MVDANAMTDDREPITFKFEPGFFTESSARGAPSRYKTGDKVRFKGAQDGIAPEKIGGWVTADVVGDTHHGVPRRAHEWTSLDGEHWIAYATNSKLFLLNRGTRYDITPIRRTVVLTDPFEMSAGVATIVVNDTDHNAELGDFVTFASSAQVGFVTISGNYEITAVFDNNRYQITLPNVNFVTATGGGTVNAKYEIGSGPASAQPATGFGVCVYGEDAYGTARSASCSDVIANLRTWSLDNFGEDLIASPRGGAVYWWDRTTGPVSRAIVLSGAPQTNQRVLLSNDGAQIICLGAFDDVAFSPDPMLIRVGAEESLNDFVVTEQNTAFDKRLSTGSEIVTGCRTRAGVFVCTDTAVYVMQDDAQNIFNVPKLAEGNSAIGPNALIEVDGVAYLMANYKFMLFDGVYQEIPCDVWQFVFADAETRIDRRQKDKVYAWFNEKFSEIWWLYAGGRGSLLDSEAGFDIATEGGDDLLIGELTECNTYVIYNKEIRRWYFGTIRRTAAIAPGKSYGVPLAFDDDGTAFAHETGSDDDGAAMAASLESHDIEIGTGKQTWDISKAVPDMIRQTGTMQLILRGKRRPNQAAYVEKGPYEFLTTTLEKGVRISARQIAMRYESDAVSDDWRLGNWTLYGKAAGER